VADYLGVSTLNVLLSAATYQKQVDHHPEIIPDYYAVVPIIFRDGEIYEDETPEKVQFIWEVGTFGFEATLKKTANGEIYLVSFFRAGRKRVKRTRRKFRRIR
jgi:hypothetical protein